MKKVNSFSFLFVFSFFLISCNSPSDEVSVASDYQQGKHFTKLSSPQVDGGKQIEVIEFFWYGCPHCFSFESHVKTWKAKQPENVKFTIVPAIFDKSWEVHAQAYYALEIMGEVDKGHEAIFNAIHQRKQNLNTPDALASVVSKAGVDPAKFKQAMRSFSVQKKLKLAYQLLRDYQIRGVPAVAVNGQYKVSGSEAGSYSKMIKIMDYLVEQEASRKGIVLK